MNFMKDKLNNKIYKSAILLTLVFIIQAIILTSCGAVAQKQSSESPESILERLNVLNEKTSSASSYTILSMQEEDLLSGKTDLSQLPCNSDEFKNSCFSSMSNVETDSKGRNVSWVEDSFMYFKFRLNGDYALSKTFVLYYNDILDSKKYSNPSDNPILQYMYISFNGKALLDKNISTESVSWVIPKEVLRGDELEVVVLFPKENGEFYAPGTKIISILGIGFADGNVETVDLSAGTAYAMQCSTTGNLNLKTTSGWYYQDEEGAFTSDNVKLYFKLTGESDFLLKVSYRTLRSTQVVKVYMNDKYIGDLSQKEDLSIPKSVITNGIQKLEFKVEGAIVASDITGDEESLVGMKVRSIVIK